MLPARVVVVALAGESVVVDDKVGPHSRQIHAAEPVSADLERRKVAKSRHSNPITTLIGGGGGCGLRISKRQGDSPDWRSTVLEYSNRRRSPREADPAGCSTGRTPSAPTSPNCRPPSLPVRCLARHPQRNPPRRLSRCQCSRLDYPSISSEKRNETKTTKLYQNCDCAQHV